MIFRIGTTCALVLALASSANAAVIGQLGILDDSANGGINPATGEPWKRGDQYRLAFVTSTAVPSTSHDIAFYNTHVQNAANAAGLGSVTWNAIASTSTADGGFANVDARDNTGTNPSLDPVGVGIFLVDGTTKIADGYSDLWDGDIDNPIGTTELNTAYDAPDGSPFGTFEGVWTGTDQFGVNRGVAALGGSRSDLGLAIATNSQWTRRADIMGGDNELPLGVYAISETLTIPIPEPSTLTFGSLGFFGLMFRRRTGREQS